MAAAVNYSLLCQAFWHETGQVLQPVVQKLRFMPCLLDSWSKLNMVKMFSATAARHSQGIWGTDQCFKAAEDSRTHP